MASRFETGRDDRVNASRFQCNCFLHCSSGSSSDYASLPTLLKDIGRWDTKRKAEYRRSLMKDHFNLVFKPRQEGGRFLRQGYSELVKIGFKYLSRFFKLLI